jgi:phage terminase small subunit
VNSRHERFIVEYLKDLNATKAYIRCGYSKKGAGQSAAALLKNPKIAAEIAKRAGERQERAELSATRTLEEMRRLAFSNVQDLFDEHGDLIPIHKLTREQAACIASLEVIMKNATAGDGKIDRVLKLKVWDKPKVMEMLGKHFALLTERVQIEASDSLVDALKGGRMRAATAPRGKPKK